MNKFKQLTKKALAYHYSKMCKENIDERTRLIDKLSAMKYEENPEAFKEILAEVKELSKKYDKLYEKKVKYY